MKDDEFPMLEIMRLYRIFSVDEVTSVSGRRIMFKERCDEYYSVILTECGVLKLADELRKLVRGGGA